MVEAVVLLGSSNNEIRDRIRGFRGVRSTFTPSPPWELGVMVEARSEEEITSLADRIRNSFQIRRVDVFIKPDEAEVTKPPARPKLKGIDLFEEASVALGGREGFTALETPAPETQQLTDEMRALNVSSVIRTLRSSEVSRAIDDYDSRQRLTTSMHDLFVGLSQKFDNSPDAQEALQDLAKEFQGIANEDPVTYRQDLNGITDRLEQIDEMRKVYLQNAREKGFDSDYIQKISGRRD